MVRLIVEVVEETRDNDSKSVKCKVFKETDERSTEGETMAVDGLIDEVQSRLRIASANSLPLNWESRGIEGEISEPEKEQGTFEF